MHNPAAELAETIASASPSSASVPDARAAARSFAARFYWAWPLAITAASSFLFMGRPSLWSDELATWGAVRLDWSQLFRLTGRVDAVLLPYFVLEKAWTAVAGTSDAALRLPSAAAMTAAAALIAVLGARIADWRVGVFAGLAFAFVPSTARYAQEARPYALVVLFAVLATLLLVRWIERPGVRWGLMYALAIACLGAFHLVALLLLLAHAVAARPRFRAWAGWAACGVIPLLPLVAFGFVQREQIAWLPPARLTVLGSPETLFVSGVVGGLVIGLGLLAISRKQPALVLSAWAVVPMAALVLIGQFVPLFWARYLLFIVPAWTLLAGLTLGRIPTGRAVAVLITMGVAGGPAQGNFRWPDGHGEASSQAGRIIAQNYRSGDGIAFSMLEDAFWVTRDIVSRYTPEGRRPRDVFEVSAPRENGNLAAVECDNLVSCLDGSDPPRMWVLRKHPLSDPLRGMGSAKEELLRSRYHLANLWLLQGLTLALYERS